MAWLRRRRRLWYLCERDGKKEKQTPVGHDEDQARAILATRQEADAAGMSPEEMAAFYATIAAEIRDNDRPLKDLVDDFLATKKVDVAASTYAGYELHLGRFRKSFSRGPWRGMTAGQLHKWLSTQPNATSMVRTLRHFGHYCIDEKLWPDNPLIRLKGGKSRSRKVVLSKKEIAKIEKSLAGTILEGPFLALRYTGLRVSEVCFARLENVDRERSLLRIEPWEGDEVSPKYKRVHHVSFDTKNHRVKVVYLHPKLLAAIREGTEGWLFLNTRGRRWSRHDLYRKLTNATGYYPHAYRHTFVSHLLDAGAGASTVRDLAGHSSLAVTDGYAHSNERARRQAVRKL